MQLLRDIKARVAQRRIYMKPYFLAYDKSNSSQVRTPTWWIFSTSRRHSTTNASFTVSQQACVEESSARKI